MSTFLLYLAGVIAAVAGLSWLGAMIALIFSAFE